MMVYGEGRNQEGSLNPQLTTKDYCEGGNQEGCLTPQRTIKDYGESGNLVGSLTSQSTAKDYGEGGNKEGSLSPQITTKVNEDLQDRLPEDVLNGHGEGGNQEGSLTPQRTMMDYGEGGNQEGSLNPMLTMKDYSERGNQEGCLTPQRTIEDSGENGNLVGSLTPQRTTKDYGEGFNKEGSLSPQTTTKVIEDLQNRLPEDVVMVKSYDVENSALNKSPGADAGENIGRGCQSSSLNSASVDGFLQNIDPDMESFAEQLFKNEDGGFNTTLKKRLLLSVHCRPSQDTVGKTGSREQNLCVKCNQIGQLLVCSSSDCPVVVHESCLVSRASFDDKGHFYCPFCAYSISILEYLEAKDKTLLAGKNLAEFIELLPKSLFEELRKLQSHSGLNGNEEPVGIQEIPANQVEVEGDTVKKAVDPQITYSPPEPACTLNIDGFESLTSADDELITSSDTRNSPPPVPQVLENETSMDRRRRRSAHDSFHYKTKLQRVITLGYQFLSKASASAFELAMSGAEKVVRVTGASSYIASWLVKLLLQCGYTVKATVCDPNDPKKTEHLLALDGAKERLHLFKANLLDEGCFDSIVDGCQDVFHTAFPILFSATDP
ncbi:hypothetical protein PTKIN_Ptkin09bG0172400 [Pterospermum kingtungense]